ncbi:hypothetical protein BST61_g576 [Cercospora zeina]
MTCSLWALVIWAVSSVFGRGEVRIDLLSSESRCRAPSRHPLSSADIHETPLPPQHAGSAAERAWKPPSGPMPRGRVSRPRANHPRRRLSWSSGIVETLVLVIIIIVCFFVVVTDIVISSAAKDHCHGRNIPHPEELAWDVQP